MKKLLAISLTLAASSLSAGSCGCSESCCPTEKAACIDCVCYTPQFNNLDCDCGFFISADFLYWYARETKLSYAAEFIMKPAVDVLPPFNPDTRIAAFPTDYKYLNTSWDPGFRIGLGWNMGCDGWDLSANWTYYHNHRKDSCSVPVFTGDSPLEGETGLCDRWNNMSLFGTPIWDRVSAKWSLHFNQIDLELGRKYWLSPCFTMRPYAGLRGAWSKTKFNVKGELGPKFIAPDIDERMESSTDNSNSRLWGVGFTTGIQPTWYFCRSLSLFSNLDASLLWGRFKGQQSEQIFKCEAEQRQPEVAVIFDQQQTASNHFYTMQPIIDLAIGLRWESNWCCDRFRTELDLGWEHHVWFDYGNRYLISDTSGGANPVFKTYTEVDSNLIMGGFVLRLRVDF